jgi:hypothetical protein
MDEKMTWLPTWQYMLPRQFFTGHVSWATSNPLDEKLGL